jgi:hypothetical protein
VTQPDHETRAARFLGLAKLAAGRWFGQGSPATWNLPYREMTFSYRNVLARLRLDSGANR